MIVTFGQQYHAAHRDLYVSRIMKMRAKPNISLYKLNGNIFQITGL